MRKVMDFVSVLFYHSLFASIVVSVIGYAVSVMMDSELNAEFFLSSMCYAYVIIFVWAMFDYLKLKMAESRKRFHS